MEYTATVFGKMTLARQFPSDGESPYVEVDKCKIQADSLKQLVQKLAKHFGTDVEQFLAGYSDDHTDPLKSTGLYLFGKDADEDIRHSIKIICDGQPVYLNKDNG
ncbi:hypothetical protein EFL87_11070 [Weissella confusa]|uniref:hypothetical protein n=1 Tax=Weissella confusa TaxID=1583 RepID=UPI00223C0B06|nr:hypothetical protein [Weissella confusa]MCT0042953.1 hypothetical protein [Weissella confusa]